MLRITIQDEPGLLTFQLEGRLAGRGVQELEACFNATVGQRKTILRVDLTGVTHIDAAGKSCLKALRRQGAEFLTADCLTEGIVADIANE